jgi:acyl carrier protein
LRSTPHKTQFITAGDAWPPGETGNEMSIDKAALIEDLKHRIIELLFLQDVDPATVMPETPFFKDGLGLDSIDVLEIVMMVEQEFGVRIDNKEIGQQVLVNLDSLATHITANQAG